MVSLAISAADGGGPTAQRSAAAASRQGDTTSSPGRLGRAGCERAYAQAVGRAPEAGRRTHVLTQGDAHRSRIVLPSRSADRSAPQVQAEFKRPRKERPPLRRLQAVLNSGMQPRDPRQEKARTKLERTDPAAGRRGRGMRQLKIEEAQTRMRVRDDSFETVR